jgi:hypothetical protein
MDDRNGIATCCHCNAGCDHSKENSELDCLHTVGYRDVTTKECNRKDGVADRENANHDDLKDYTIGRKKCPIPVGTSHDEGVVRLVAPPPGQTTDTQTVSASVHLQPRIQLSLEALLLVWIAILRHS